VNNHIALTLTIRLTGVDGPWLRQKLGIVVLIKTSDRIVVMAAAQQVSFCVFCDKHFWCQDIVHSVFYNFSCTP